MADLGKTGTGKARHSMRAAIMKQKALIGNSGGKGDCPPPISRDVPDEI